MPTDIDRAIIALENEIKAKRTDLAALLRAREIVEHVTKTESESAKGKSKTKPKSGIRLAEKVLHEAGKQLHIDEIRKGIAETGIKKVPAKSSLSSSLLRYAKEERIFKKVGANVFDLLIRRTPILPGA